MTTRVTKIKPKDRIILPLDVSEIDKAISLVTTLRDHVGLFKIGLNLIYSTLANLILLSNEEAIDYLAKVRALASMIDGGRVFLDVKLCDIPNTVKGASKAISNFGVRFFNVHASSGSNAVKEAVVNRGSSLVLGVTVLTSIDTVECHSIFGNSPNDQVLRFAHMLKRAGAHGVICSPQEIRVIRELPDFNDFTIVTPGVRPNWASVGDQKRIMTPAEAVKAGADYLVIGRPIIDPPPEIGGPVEAAKLIVNEIEEALG